MGDTKLRHLFEEAQPSRELHWFRGPTHGSLFCDFEKERISFELLSWERFRISWDAGSCEAWINYQRRAIASDGGFDITTEPDLVYLGPGPRIQWSGFGDNVYLKWEDGAKILHSGNVWRDSDRKVGVKFMEVLDGPISRELAPLVISLPLLIQRIPSPPHATVDSA